MRVLVTGSAGHLGEALVRVLPERGHEPVGLDLLASPHTHVVGSIADRDTVHRAIAGCDAVIHTATLHKPHIASHPREQFVETNTIGTLTLLEEAVAGRIGRFVFTSTTSAFGRALRPAVGEPAAWITEDIVPVPRNIYGVTKCAAEDLCELIAHDHGLPCLILRTSRFFPEADDLPEAREAYDDLNLKVNELLYRRVDIEDVVAAHLCALERAPAIGFGRYVITATTPFAREHLVALRSDAAAVVRDLFPGVDELYERRGWTLLPSIERVYVNARARHDLDWAPVHDFGRALAALAAGADPRSELARAIGAKGYHAVPTGVYTTRAR